jgi:hypothetical protein
MSAFRVHVDSESNAPANDTCQTGVRYRITVALDGGSPPGIFPDAHGHRVLWLENGRYVGCSGSVTSPLDAECNRFRQDDQQRRIWQNGTEPAG